MAPAGPAPRTHTSQASCVAIRETLGRCCGDPDVGLQGIAEPSADVVAGRAPAMHHFVMAPATAQITCPTGPAGLLLVHGALVEPDTLPLTIDTGRDIAHCRAAVLDEPMASVEVARGRDAEIAPTGAAWIRAMRAA